MSRQLTFAAALVLVAACRAAGGRGTLTARWIAAADTAALTVPATAIWCTGPARLDIFAVAGDTALGLAIYPSDSNAVAGSYPVVAPGARVQVRPAAGVALRWVGKVFVLGWWGDSGAVTVTGGPGRALSGRGQAWLISNLGPDSVTSLEFSFQSLHVRTDSLCDAPAVQDSVPATSPVEAGTPPEPGVN